MGIPAMAIMVMGIMAMVMATMVAGMVLESIWARLSIHILTTTRITLTPTTPILTTRLWL